MKQLIKDVLEDIAKGQTNLESEAAREMIANLIVASIESKGGRVFYGEPTTADEHNEEYEEEPIFFDINGNCFFGTPEDNESGGYIEEGS